MASNFKLGLIINPVAGMGGKVGLHGTDNELAQLAISQGAKKVSFDRTYRTISMLLAMQNSIDFYTPDGVMGGDLLKSLGIKFTEIKFTQDLITEDTNSLHTQSCVSSMIEQNIDAIIFAGGDGTARDIFAIVGNKVPILGIPSGVKMRSGVFANYPEHAALILQDVLAARGENNVFKLIDADILDAAMDSKEYSASEFYGNALTFKAPSRIANPKVNSHSNQDVALMELTASLSKNLEPDRLYLFGPGQSTKAILDNLGSRYSGKSPAGVGAYYGGEIIGQDLSEMAILDLLNRFCSSQGFKSPLLYLGVIGGQGFLLGRGNQQLSFEVISKIGIENIYVLANSGKINQIVPSRLYVDFGDAVHLKIFGDYVKVHVAIDRTLVCKVLSSGVVPKI